MTGDSLVNELGGTQLSSCTLPVNMDPGFPICKMG